MVSAPGCRKEFGESPSNRDSVAVELLDVRRRPIDRALFHAAAALTAGLLLIWTFRDVRPTDVSALLNRIGPWGAALLLLPQLTSAAFETCGWRLSFWCAKVRYLPLLRVRLATESAAACLPAGVVFAESLKLPLLVHHLGLSVPESVSAIAARKYLLLTSQAAYIMIAVGLGWQALMQASPGVLGRGFLPELILACAVALALAGLGTRLLLSQGHVADSVRRSLAQLPIPALQRAVAANASSFAETDGNLQRFFQMHWARESVTSVWFLAGWVVEALETFLILRFLGIDLDFLTVMSFEVILSLVKSLVFVLPAGLGVQDAGYVIFLRALGVPDASTAGAAFSLVKRTKELAFAALGFWLLTGDLRFARSALSGPSPEH